MNLIHKLKYIFAVKNNFKKNEVFLLLINLSTFEMKKIAEICQKKCFFNQNGFTLVDTSYKN